MYVKVFFVPSLIFYLMYFVNLKSLFLMFTMNLKCHNVMQII